MRTNDATAKGNIIESETEGFLMWLGFKVYTTRRSRYGANDFFNAFDHVCIASEETENMQKFMPGAAEAGTVFVQTKLNGGCRAKDVEKHKSIGAPSSWHFNWVPSKRRLYIYRFAKGEYLGRKLYTFEEVPNGESVIERLESREKAIAAKADREDKRRRRQVP